MPEPESTRKILQNGEVESPNGALQTPFVDVSIFIVLFSSRWQKWHLCAKSSRTVWLRAQSELSSPLSSIHFFFSGVVDGRSGIYAQNAAERCG